MNLVFATRNRGKVTELAALMPAKIDVISLEQFPNAPEVEEDGNTYEANAIKKAQTIANYTKLPALADDSGLEVETLGGAPGIYSARYATRAENQTQDQANNQKLLATLLDETDRRARFVCVLAYADPEGTTWTVRGECAGKLLTELRGKNGFGYDPLFVPHGQTQTFAELPASTKNKISHRACAFGEFVSHLTRK